MGAAPFTVSAATRAASTGAAATGAAAPSTASPMGPAATSAASTGVAATGAAVQEAAPPAKRRKPAVCVSRASARYAVVSKRRDSCLSGSSPLESPEKVRGMEEFIDNFRIEFGEDELQREEMEEKEMEEKEMEEKEMEEKEMEEKEMEEKEMEDKEIEAKEREMEKEREEEGELPFRVLKPPFSNQQGFTCSCCLSTNDNTAYPFCVCCGVKVSLDEYLAF
jgi:hypothetical protein